MSEWTPDANPRAYRFELPKKDKYYKAWYARITPQIFRDATQKGSCLVETPGENSDSMFARAMIAEDVGTYARKVAGLATFTVRSGLRGEFARSSSRILDEVTASYGKQVLIIIEGIDTEETPLLASVRKNLHTQMSPTVATTFQGELDGEYMSEFFMASRLFDKNNGAPVAHASRQTEYGVQSSGSSISSLPVFESARLP